MTRNFTLAQKGGKTPFSPLQKQLLSELTEVMNGDYVRLKRCIRTLSHKGEEEQMKLAQSIRQQIGEAQLLLKMRQQNVPTITFPEHLPVSLRRGEIEKLLQENQVIVVAGETGSGKTTQLPKMCLRLGLGAKGFIGHTQPRRIATRTVASRIAEELNTPLGELVGYKVRFKDEISPQTQIKLMTDGILLAEIQSDPLLWQYEVLIIDEAHERSLNNDFILGYLKTILPKRPDLRVIITSATIDVERFSQHFNNAPIVEVSGRTFPVDVLYRPLNEEKGIDQADGILKAVQELQKMGRGDILVFLSGEREIRDTAEVLEKAELRHTEILPLYARLSLQEQNKIFHPNGLNRIVLATNVAETSLTVPGIRYVIDTGFARISRYSYRTKVQRLPIEPISQASANQRKGRCGRVAEGVCIRLYSEEDFNNRPKFTDPEILRTNLASVILQMMALGLDNIAHFPFIDPPDTRHIQDGIRLLEELQAIEKCTTKSKLTHIGRQLAKLPTDPRLSKMLLTAVGEGSLHEVMVIVSALSIQDPRERPQEKQQASDEMHRRFFDPKSDFLSLLNLWQYVQTQQKALTKNQFRRLCQKEYLNYLRLREWQDIYHQIRLTVREMGLPINREPAPYAQIHIAILSGLLAHIGEKMTEKPLYLGARQRQFAIFPNSALFKKQPKWCMAGELVETRKLWGRVVAEISPEWVEPLAKHLVKKSYNEPRWSKSQGAVIADEKVTLYGVPIVEKRTVNYGKIDPILSREIFIREALVAGNWHTHHQFYQQNLALIAEVETLENKTRRRDILVDDNVLFDFYNQRIPEEIVSQTHFDKWWRTKSQTEPHYLNLEKAFLMKDDSPISELDFPNFWYQGNMTLPLSYQFDPTLENDGVTVEIPLPLLNQIDVTGFDWQIPALREELVIALIKSLPKNIRKNFVPAPNYAQAFLARNTAHTKPLLESLTDELRKMTGVTVAKESWDWANLPKHLKMHFKVVDEQGKNISQSQDLDTLKVALKEQVQSSLATLAEDHIEQTGLTAWHFGTLPPCYEHKKAGLTLKAFPALVDEKNAVGIRLFETEYEQQMAMQTGLRRLLLLNVPSPIKYLHEKLPNKAKLGLYFAPFGNVVALIDDCIACAVDKLIDEYGGMVWDEASFKQLTAFVRANLNDTTCHIACLVEEILTLSFQLNKRLKGKLDLRTAFAFSDINAQLAGLIYPDFVAKSGEHRLKDIKRYILAMDKRIDKLAQDPNRDRANMLKVEQVQKAYQTLLAKLPKSKPIPEGIQGIRFMIEELRVSLFAQQLGTPYPVSDKRILKAIEKMG